MIANPESSIEQRVQPRYRYAGALSYAFPFFITVGILWVFLKADIDRQYERAMQDSAARTGAIASAVQGELGTKIAVIDQALSSAITQVESGNFQNLERFLPVELQIKKDGNQKSSLKIYEFPESNQYATSALEPGPLVKKAILQELSVRRVIKAHGLIVFKLDVSATDGESRIIFARATNSASAAPIRVVALEMGTDLFRLRVNQLYGASGFLIAIFNDREQLLWARTKQSEKIVNDQTLESAWESQRLASTQDTLSQTNGQRPFRMRLSQESPDRLYTWHKLNDSPLVLLVGHSYEEATQQYRVSRDRYLMFGLAISLLLTASLYWFFAFRHSAEQAEIRQKVSIELLKEREQELAESRESLRQLTAREFDLKEEERKRIALEIHDELGQRLTALRLELALAEKAASGPEAKASPTSFRKLKVQVDKIIEIVRDITFRLRPAALEVGLVEATIGLLQAFRRSTKMGVEFDNQLPESFLMSESKTVVVFRILQESLTNVARHAKAKNLRLGFSCENGSFLMKITDDGRGFDLASLKDRPSTGLSGMRERAASIGGELSVSSIKAVGTTVQVIIPNYSEMSGEGYARN